MLRFFLVYKLLPIMACLYFEVEQFSILNVHGPKVEKQNISKVY